jgi:segregation and condensation protein A
MPGYEKVMDHLLFHQALEEEEPEKMARYVQLLNRVQEGRIVPTANRYEDSVVTAFELVLEDSFDPWDIDLARFSREYLKRLRRLETVNFVAAGRLVLLAWSVLKLQSERILSTAETVNPPPEEIDDGWDVMPGFYQAPDQVDLTYQILHGEEPPLKEGFHREIQRPVSLVDLLEALDQAFHETSGAVARPSNLESTPAVEDLRDKLHREDLAEDLQWAWDCIRAQGEEVTCLGELNHGDPWDRATLFLSVLFLADMGWLEVWQKELPHGEIYLRPLHEDETITPKTLPAAEVA